MRPSFYPLGLALVVCGLLCTNPPAAADSSSMREPLFKTTDAARDRAESRDATVLAPLSYAEAIDDYQRADAILNRGGSVDTIRRYLARAETHFNRAGDGAAVAAVALAAAIKAREDALASQAPTFAADEWRDAEADFASATRKLERGSIKAARRYGDNAEAAYRACELNAIKANYLSETRDFIRLAEKLRADRYAPVSLADAQRLLESADQELNSNRYDTDRPRSLAVDARHSALHAIYISKLEHRIRNRDSNLEGVLLEWQTSIKRLGDALDTPVYFDYGEAGAIDALLTEMSRLKLKQTSLVQQVNDRDQSLLALNEQVSKMQELLGGGSQTIDELEVLLAEQARRLERQARHRERFATIESLFAANQATVLRQGDTVIIRLIGLNFDSASAGLKQEHLDILAILEQAISEFPESGVVVEGHTDAFGSDAENLTLSQARADNVVRHLLDSLPISPLNLDAQGFGESKPVANNETAEGRKRNRRIDVVIQPYWISEQTVAQVERPEYRLESTQ